VKRALKKQSSRPALEQKRTTAKQFVKDSYAQIQNNKELLAELQPALEAEENLKSSTRGRTEELDN
jgi:hypothetical protein